MNQMKAGAMLSYLSIFITIGIALLYTPVMIRLLGQEEYGLYMLIGSVAAYLSVLDLGLGNAIVRYTARNRAIGDKASESKLNGMFLVLYSVIGLITIIIGGGLYSAVGNIFGANLSEAEIEKAKLMVIILVINFALSFPLSVFGAIMQAYERFVFIKMIAILRTLLVPLVTLPLLLFGYGSVTMVFITSLVNIACLLVNVIYCFNKLKVRFHFGNLDFEILREIIGYSFFIFLNIIIDRIYWSTDQVVLGIVSGTMAVAVYAIAIQFINLYMMLSTAISGVFLPKVTMMVAKNASSKELTGIMVKFGRIQFIVMALILSGFYLYGKPFINLWAGANYTKAYYIVLIIMLPLTIPMIQNIGISILQAMNLHIFRSVLYLIIALLNIIITLPVAMHYGGIGTAIVTGASLLMGHIIIMNVYYHRKIGIQIPLFWRSISTLTVPVILATFAGVIMEYFITSNDVLFIVCKIIIYIIIYFILMWFIGFNNYEKKLFGSILKKIFQIRQNMN